MSKVNRVTGILVRLVRLIATGSVVGRPISARGVRVTIRANTYGHSGEKEVFLGSSAFGREIRSNVASYSVTNNATSDVI